MHYKELKEEVAVGLLFFTAYWIVWLIRKICDLKRHPKVSLYNMCFSFSLELISN